ncbi:unnamed protein product [Peniophora sp. CBMAI 1063]|nr:unnamed protein product [Peniophora sp. CBMAI 1063]
MTTQFKDRNLLAVIGDEDTVTGMLLAGIGQVGEHRKKNFFIVDSKTQVPTIEAVFEEYTERNRVVAAHRLTTLQALIDPALLT